MTEDEAREIIQAVAEADYDALPANTCPHCGGALRNAEEP